MLALNPFFCGSNFMAVNDLLNHFHSIVWLLNNLSTIETVRTNVRIPQEYQFSSNTYQCNFC